MSRTARGPLGRTGVVRISGNTMDITEWIDFKMNDLVWFLDTAKRLKNPLTEGGSRRLGRWIGIAHQIGSNLCYWVLPKTGVPMARTTVQHVTELNLQVDEIKEKVNAFESKQGERLKDDNHIIEEIDDAENVS